ncbi:pyrophosphatase [Mycobacterium phage Patience]|uniref:MazG-like nucleotide pyrophosphohydrolase n=1 Tax=Mycobacterium phage Patience TaxID=1074308 RepID=G1JWL3_9CAUD|nr:pyrophosphatase [Mycobacterium phage Patience]AEL98011.1 hypothetical protein PATIENCE_103 [Mycobacterium phage Patience]
MTSTLNSFVNPVGNISGEGKIKIIEGLTVLATAVARNNYEKGWREPGAVPRPIGDLIALLHSEVTEAFEAYRNNEPELWFEYPDKETPFEEFRTDPDTGETTLGKPQGITSELADVIIRVFDMAAELELPLVEALLAKHEYNQTRPYRHGGKAV